MLFPRGAIDDPLEQPGWSPFLASTDPEAAQRMACLMHPAVGEPTPAVRALRKGSWRLLEASSEAAGGPTERWGAAVAGHDGCMVVACGLRGGSKFLSDAWSRPLPASGEGDAPALRSAGAPTIQSAQSAWGPTPNDCLPEMPHAAAAIVGGALVIVGIHGLAYALTLSRGAPSAGKWRPLALPSGPGVRSTTGHAAAALGGAVYVFGGVGGPEERVLCDLHRLDARTGEWRLMPAGKGRRPAPRSSASMWADPTVGDSGSIFVFGVLHALLRLA